MRTLMSAVVAVALVAVNFPIAPGTAQTRGTAANMNPSEKPADAAVLVAFTIRSFPSGGEPLKAAITDLVIKYPRFATHVAVHLRNDRSLSPAQRDAVIAGLAAALHRLGVVAQADGVDPLTLALILGGAGAAGFGLYQATKGSGSSTPVVSPN